MTNNDIAKGLVEDTAFAPLFLEDMASQEPSDLGNLKRKERAATVEAVELLEDEDLPEELPDNDMEPGEEFKGQILNFLDT